MESLLIDEWLGATMSRIERESQATRIALLDEASVSVVREHVRLEGAKVRMPQVAIERLVNVASELARNQWAHARYGEIAIHPIERDSVPGLEIIAADRGGGIADPTSALRGDRAQSPFRSSLGVGLAAVLELADEVDFDIRVGEGSCIWARKFAEPVCRRREIGIYGRPFPGERVSGDHACFVRTEGALLVGVADGLGHGPAARLASMQAICTLREEAVMPVDGILAACHRTLASTRGAVMTVARFIEPSGGVEAAAVGNVGLHIYGRGRSYRISGPSSVLGAPGPTRRPNSEVRSLEPYDVAVIFTDGLSTRTNIEGDLDLMREHPIRIAHALAGRFGKDNDDILVMAVR